jgi:hypothetical protein
VLRRGAKAMDDLFNAHRAASEPPLCPPRPVRTKLSAEMTPMRLEPDQGRQYVELVRLYSNLQDHEARLRELVTAASSQRPAEALHRPRQHQHRLSAGEVAEVIAGYAQRESIKQLAMRFAIHRTTVVALLRRHHDRGR